jgi:hypothetical protein
MGGLAGYTLLLALAAFLLVRFARDWEDLRTVLLLVVLMFLATSVTFDELLVISPGRGAACYLIGLAFTILVSEAVLRGIRLVLPAGFRVPYYIILSLFFLYPLGLRPFVDEPHSEALLWGLFGFSAAAGLCFLTLLPAIWRGPNYVDKNGSPWQWPLYPWVLFGLLGVAVPARAYLLCFSMHLLPAVDGTRLIFGPYFLVPFGLAVAVLLMEIGLVSGRRAVLWTALAVPTALLVLAVIGHRDDPIYREFLDLFSARLGGSPLFLTLLALAVIYVYAMLRRVPFATEALTAVLLALAFMGVFNGDRSIHQSSVWVPLLAAALLQLLLGWRRSAWRCLFAAECLAGVTASLLPQEIAATPLGYAVVFHVALLGILVVGAAFQNEAGRLLRTIGAALALAGCSFALFGGLDRIEDVPFWVVALYAPVMALLLVAYGLLLGHRVSLAVALLVIVWWLARSIWSSYFTARQVVTGLDQIVLSIMLLVLAFLISLTKSGMLARWVPQWTMTRRVPDVVNSGGTNLEQGPVQE